MATKKTKTEASKAELTPEEETALAQIDGKSRAVEVMKEVMEKNGWTLNDIVAAFGPIKLVADTKAIRPDTRKARAAAMERVHVEIQPEDRAHLEDAIKILEADLPEVAEDGEVLTQAAIDDLAHRAKAMKRIEDLFKGRLAGIKRTVFEALDLIVGPNEKGALISVAEGTKLERTVSTSYTYDLELLRESVDNKTFLALTSTERVLNEDKLDKALRDGIISQDQWKAISDVERFVDEEKVAKAIDQKKVTAPQIYDTVITSTTAKFFVKPLKDGEEVDF